MSVLLVYKDDCEWREVAGAFPDTPEGLAHAIEVCEAPEDKNPQWWEWTVHRLHYGLNKEDDDKTQVHPDPTQVVADPRHGKPANHPAWSMGSVGVQAVRKQVG